VTYEQHAYVAIVDIYCPLFKPDVMLGDERDAALFMDTLSPMFQQVAQNLTEHDQVILYSARQSFDLEKDYWAFHRFAIGKNRDQIEKQMANNPSLILFDNLKVNLSTLVRVLILTYLKAKTGCDNRGSSS
jgi:predicted DNA-binding ribbon-helix-helix protein